MAKRLFLSLLLLLAPGVDAQQKTYPESYIREQVGQIIRERHPSDSRDWWRALGPTAPGIMIRMYHETDRMEHRMRLVSGLSWFDTAEVRDFLVDEAKGTDQTGIRIEAVKSLGQSQGTKSLDRMQEFLKHKDANTRLAAARALNRMMMQLRGERAKEVKEVLEKYLEREPLSWIKMSLAGHVPKVKPGQLRWVTSSSDRLSSQLNGDWEGYWLQPSSVSAKKKRACSLGRPAPS